MEHSLETARPWLVRGLEPEQRNLGVGEISDHLAIPRGDLVRDAFQIHPPPLPERQYLIAIDQQRVRPALGFRTGIEELGLANCGRCQLWVHVWVIKEPKDEFLSQQAAYRNINSIFADPALLHELHDQLGPRLAP